MDGYSTIRDRYAPLARWVLCGQRDRIARREPLAVLKANAFNEALHRTPVEDYAGDARVRLVDIDRETVEKAREAYPDLDIAWGDVRDLSWPDGTFDVVLDLSTIDHLPDPQRAIREYARVLKPGGVLCLVSWVHLCRGTQQRPSAYGGTQYFFDVRVLRTFLLEHFAIEDGRILTPGLVGTYGGHDVDNVDVHAYICRR